MTFLNFKKIFFIATLLTLFVGSLFTFCHMFAMNMQIMSTKVNSVVAPSELCCGNEPSGHHMVSNRLKDVLFESSVAEKAGVSFLAAAFIIISLLDLSIVQKSLSFYYKNTFIPPPNYLSLAFADGILNSKIYSA